MNIQQTTPSIYVADLAAYNEGHLHGKWLDLSEHDLDSLDAEVADLLATSPASHAEEIAIHDSEGFGGWLGEYSGLESAVRLADMILEHGEVLAFAALNYAGGVYDLDSAEEFLNRYVGAYPTARHWAEEELEAEFSALPKSTQRKLELYFDYESYVSDREMNGDLEIVEDDGKVHIFIHRAE